MIAIVQVHQHDDDPGGLRTYEVRINQEVITEFTHYRREGLAKCLRLAANAVEDHDAAMFWKDAGMVHDSSKKREKP